MLERFEEQYQKIMAEKNVSENRRAVKLAALMTDLEGEFRIPVATNFKKWEEENPVVASFYKKVSTSRNFDE